MSRSFRSASARSAGSSGSGNSSSIGSVGTPATHPRYASHPVSLPSGMEHPPGAVRRCTPCRWPCSTGVAVCTSSTRKCAPPLTPPPHTSSGAPGATTCSLIILRRRCSPMTARRSTACRMRHTTRQCDSTCPSPPISKRRASRYPPAPTGSCRSSASGA